MQRFFQRAFAASRVAPLVHRRTPKRRGALDEREIVVSTHVFTDGKAVCCHHRQFPPMRHHLVNERGHEGLQLLQHRPAMGKESQILARSGVFAVCFAVTSPAAGILLLGEAGKRCLKRMRNETVIPRRGAGAYHTAFLFARHRLVGG